MAKLVKYATRLSIHKLRILPTRDHPNERSSFDCASDSAIGGAGFRISIFDERGRSDSSKPRLEPVVVDRYENLRIITNFAFEFTKRPPEKRLPRNRLDFRPHLLGGEERR